MTPERLREIRSALTDDKLYPDARSPIWKENGIQWSNEDLFDACSRDFVCELLNGLAAEREACAQIAEKYGSAENSYTPHMVFYNSIGSDIAKAIRARRGGE